MHLGSDVTLSGPAARRYASTDSTPTECTDFAASRPSRRAPCQCGTRLLLDVSLGDRL